MVEYQYLTKCLDKISVASFFEFATLVLFFILLHQKETNKVTALTGQQYPQESSTLSI